MSTHKWDLGRYLDDHPEVATAAVEARIAGVRPEWIEYWILRIEVQEKSPGATPGVLKTTMKWNMYKEPMLDFYQKILNQNKRRYERRQLHRARA